MSLTRSRRFVLAALFAGAFVWVGCQEVEQPSPTLTEKQWAEVQDHITDPEKNPEKVPEPEYKIGANYDDKIELVGFSVGDPNKKEEAIVAGEKTTFRWYWKVLDDLDKNWQIFVHFDSKDTSVAPAKRRQNLDHKPLSGLFPTSKWPKGKIIEDVQTVRIRDDYPAGPAVPYVGFWRGKTRLPIKNDVPKTNDRRVKAPSLNVTNNSGQAAGGSQKPTYTVEKVDAKSAEAIEIDGKLDDEIWKQTDALSLSAFGSAPNLTTEIDVARSDEHLFVGARLEDEHVWSHKSERDSNTWEEEVVELFVDPNGDGQNYLELQVNPKGTIFDANFKDRLGTGKGSRKAQIDRAKEFTLEGLDSAVHVDGTLNDDSDEDTSWSVELKIPVESLPGIDEADTAFDRAWAVNLYRFDRPAKDTTHAYGWSTAPRGDFHQVGKFGQFRFGQPSDDSGKGNTHRAFEKVDPEIVRQRLKKVTGNQKLPTTVPPKIQKKIKKLNTKE